MLSQCLTTEQHFLQQTVNPGYAKQLGKLNLLNHLPSDGLKCRQGEQDFSETAACVVLPVAYVVLQVHLNLIA